MDHDNGAGLGDLSSSGDAIADIISRWHSDTEFAAALAFTDDRDVALAPFGLSADERARIDRLLDGEVTYGHLFGLPDAPGADGTDNDSTGGM